MDNVFGGKGFIYLVKLTTVGIIHYSLSNIWAVFKNWKGF